MSDEKRKDLLASQWEYCIEHDLPLLAPPNGICYYCNKDIVNSDWKKTHITYCVHCMKSFCE